jgi:hypothetical protein
MPCLSSRAHLLGPAARATQYYARRTRAQPLMLRVCFRSLLRREPRRWQVVRSCGARSVSPVPARIALQGGERAGADAMTHSPPQERATSVTCLAGHLALPGTNLSSKAGTGCPYATANEHTRSLVLAEPFNNNKKPRRGQRVSINLNSTPEGRLREQKKFTRHPHTAIPFVLFPTSA